MTDHTRLGAYGLQKNLALQSALLNPNVRQVLELLNKSNPMVRLTPSIHVIVVRLTLFSFNFFD